MAKDAREQEELITEQRSKMLQTEYVDARKLGEFPLVRDILQPKEIRALKIAPLSANDQRMELAYTVETSKSTIDKIKSKFKSYIVDFKLVSRSGMMEIVNRYDPPPKIEHSDVMIIDEGSGANIRQISEQLDKTKPKEIFAFLLRQAYILNSSDIHIEPGRGAVRIRFRIDGTLHVVAMMNSDKYFYMLSDIAARSGITANVNVPQSGRITQEFADSRNRKKAVSMRVETVPTIHGQDIVVRIFNLDVNLLDIDRMELSQTKRQNIDKIISHPHGLVLVVGPTGSGKSTTLYSILNKLNTTQRKLVTLEDPVEFEIDGVTQIPVFTDDKDSFSEKLKAVLREDPDVIMVGEIREIDTARTALQAALTGHLVLATFHASSAAAAVSRLMDMIGHNPLLASAIRLIMAQRLVRTLKDECAEEYKPEENVISEIKRAFKDSKLDIDKRLSEAKFRRPKQGDDACDIPYQGRTMIMEQLMMDPIIEKAISGSAVKETTTQDIHRLAVEQGMQTMLQDGLLKAMSGSTSVEEIFRVVDIGV